MLSTQTGVPVEAICLDAPTGAVGTITVEVYDPTDGATILAPTTTGITEPRPGTYQAMLTVAVTGTFSVRWALPDGLTAEEELTVYAVAATDPDIVRPSLADLGGIMRARTRDSHGVELGTFTMDTRPNSDEANGVIDQALNLVAPRLGNVPPRLSGMAKSLVALRAAMLVESSYFAEDTSQNGELSSYAAYRDQYRDALADFDSTAVGDVGQTRQKTKSLALRTIYTTGS